MHAKQTLSIILRIPEDIRWVKDSNQIILLKEKDKENYFLQDVEAVIWSWLSCSYKYTKLVKMVSSLLLLSNEDSEILLSKIFNDWLALGIIEIIEEQPIG